MNGISSYALKTVVMNMITEQPNKDWKPSLKAVLFLEVSGMWHRKFQVKICKLFLHLGS